MQALKKIQIILIMIFLSTIITGNIHAENYAVLISATRPELDEDGLNSAFWYDTILMYELLHDKYGYSHENIHVLFGTEKPNEPLDFQSTIFSNRYNSFNKWNRYIVDQPCDKENIEGVFKDSLKTVVTDKDFLFIFLMSHGEPDGDRNGYPDIKFRIEAPYYYTGLPFEYMTDVEFTGYINEVDHYRKRAVIVLSCFAVGIIHDIGVEGAEDNTFVLASADYDFSYGVSDDYNLIHSGFVLDFYRALALKDPYNIHQYSIDSFDFDYNGLVSLYEVYQNIFDDKARIAGEGYYSWQGVPSYGDDGKNMYLFSKGHLEADETTFLYDIVLTDTVFVDYGCTLDVAGLEYQTVYVSFEIGKLIVEDGGTLSADNAVFTKQLDANWDGIEINPGACLTIGDDDTIKYATTGLYLKEDVTINPDEFLTIQNCSQNGIKIYNASPHIYNVKIDTTTGTFYSIDINGSSSDATIYTTTIKNTQNGIYLGAYTDATLRNSNIDSTAISTANITVYNFATLDLHTAHNNIYLREGRYAIKNFPMANNITAVLNYWGYSTVDNSFFWDPNNIGYDPYHTSENDNGAPPLGKIAVSETDIVMNYFRSGTELEKSGDWNGALEKYNAVLSITDLPQWRRKAIKRIIRVCNRSNLDYNDVRSIINNELSTATGNYKAVLDYLLCNLIAREALREKDQEIRRSKYETAIDAFSTNAEQYRGTYMEVEMLCRIATLYGDHLNDKDSAELYADRAASLDQGHGSLVAAYASAGMEYNLQHLDKPADGEEPQPEPEKPASEEIQEFVTVSPNPSNPRTTISYSIKNPSHVKLVIYSITGQKVATLVNKPMSAGSHSVIFDGSNLGSGVYLYKFESKGFSKMGKMMLMK